MEVTRADGSTSSFPARVRIDTANELEYFRHGGILHYVLRSLARGRGATALDQSPCPAWLKVRGH